MECYLACEPTAREWKGAVEGGGRGGGGGDGACALRLRAAVHQILVQPSMGPLQLAVTWYKIHHAGEQAPQWDIHNKENANLS